MTTHKINPDSTMLQQADGQWQKFAMLILFKLAGREKVTVTAADIAQLSERFAPGIPVVMIHGHSDSIDFQVIDEAAAHRLAVHEATMKGSA